MKFKIFSRNKVLRVLFILLLKKIISLVLQVLVSFIFYSGWIQLAIFYILLLIIFYIIIFLYH